MINFSERPRFALAALCLAAIAATAACSGRAGSGVLVPAQSATLDGSARPQVPVRAKWLYVGAPGRIFVFPATASGTPKPSAEITGSKTMLVSPAYLAYDGSRNWIWVTSCNPSSPAAQSVLAFSATAKGNVAPVAIIGGSSTTLSSCQQGISVDSNGNVFVADFKSNQIAVWATAGKTGTIDAAPDRTITGLLAPVGLAVGPTGNTVVVDSCLNVTPACAGDVRVFAANVSGAATPLKTITSTTYINTPKVLVPAGAALDRAGNIYVSSGGLGKYNYVVAFAATTKSGNVAHPYRVITDPVKNQYGQPTQVSLDGLGYTYVGNSFSLYAVLPVIVWKPKVNGSVKPVSTILTPGVYPHLYPPTAIAVH